jgi:hypothetical protein
MPFSLLLIIVSAYTANALLRSPTSDVGVVQISSVAVSNCDQLKTKNIVKLLHCGTSSCVHIEAPTERLLDGIFPLFVDRWSFSLSD